MVHKLGKLMERNMESELAHIYTSSLNAEFSATQQR